MKKLIALLIAMMLLCGVAVAETVDATSGASQVTTPETQMTQEEIKAMTLDYLRGFPLVKNEDGTTKEWAYREMYQIATVHDNMPGLSSVEFVLDPETMHLYCSSEKGTEKCVDIASNPNVVMYWYKQIPEDAYVPQVNDYFNSYGVQIKGTAKLMDGTEDTFFRGASLYMRTLYGPDRWDAMDEETQKATITRVGSFNEWIEIIPTEYNVTSLFWSYNKEGSQRPQYYDPESPTFGKDPRQVLIVK